MTTIDTNDDELREALRANIDQLEELVVQLDLIGDRLDALDGRVGRLTPSEGSS